MKKRDGVDKESKSVESGPYETPKKWKLIHPQPRRISALDDITIGPMLEPEKRIRSSGRAIDQIDFPIVQNERPDRSFGEPLQSPEEELDIETLKAQIEKKKMDALREERRELAKVRTKLEIKKTEDAIRKLTEKKEQENFSANTEYQELVEKSENLKFIDYFLELGMIPNPSEFRKTNPTLYDLASSYKKKEMALKTIERYAAGKNLTSDEKFELIVVEKRLGYSPTSEEAKAHSTIFLSNLKTLVQQKTKSDSGPISSQSISATSPDPKVSKPTLQECREFLQTHNPIEPDS